MQGFGKMLILFGLILVVIGGIFFLGAKLGIGRLPGDIYYQKGNFSFYFPVVSSIMISIILTIILNLFIRR